MERFIGDLCTVELWTLESFFFFRLVYCRVVNFGEVYCRVV